MTSAASEGSSSAEQPSAPAAAEATESERKKESKDLPIEEVAGDLFTCPASSSLAHCVSRDCGMGKGIAKLFKAKFGGVDELKAQRKAIGQCAILKRGSRFVYYMITKERYFHKPTMASVKATLLDMRKHCQENKVAHLCMPRIACGLDGLDWTKVKPMIAEVFASSGIRITIYTI